MILATRCRLDLTKCIVAKCAKQTGMVDDFEDFFKAKSLCSCETKPSPTLYFSQNTPMLTESRGEFGDLHSILLDFVNFAFITRWFLIGAIRSVS